MTKNILIISVHPDDETLGAGGAILKHQKNAEFLECRIVNIPSSVIV